MNESDNWLDTFDWTSVEPIPGTVAHGMEDLLLPNEGIIAELQLSRVTIHDFTTNARKPRQSKQLVFDYRYGWVYGEWKEPAEIAHLGGRGMFSIVPLTAAVLGRTLESFRRTLESANKTADMVSGCIQDPPSLQSATTFLRGAHAKADEDLRSWLRKMKDNSSTLSFKVPG